MLMWSRVARAGLSLGVVSMLAVGGCSTETKTTDVWKDPSYVAGPKSNIIVVAGRMTDVNRRIVEDGLVAGLVEHGVHARPSYAVFPGRLPSRQEMKSAVLGAGFDGVLVTTFQRVKERQYYEPGEPDLWGGYYGWGMASDDLGTTIVDESVLFVTTLWDPREGKLLWSANTETANPSSGKDFVTSLRKEVIPALSKVGLLPAKAPPPVSFRRPNEGRSQL